MTLAARGECLRVVAALGDEDDPAIAQGIGSSRQPRDKGREPARGDLHPRQRIVLVRVEPGRDDHQAGAVFLEDRVDDRAIDEIEVGVAGACTEGQVDRPSNPSPRPTSDAAPAPG